MKKIKFILLVLIIVIAGVFHRNIMGVVYPRKYSDIVEKYSREYHLDENLVYSIIKAESNFNPDAVSKKNAKGLMQLSDGTSRWAEEKLKYKNIDVFNPKYNIEMGCWYLNRLFMEFDDEDLVIAAYNGGSGNVRKWLANNEYSKEGRLHSIPFRETDKYSRKVRRNKKIYDYIYGKKDGFLNAE